MGGVLAAKHVQRAGFGDDAVQVWVLPGQQAGDAVVIGVGVAAQVGAVFKHAARVGFLQQQGRGEFRPVEMPVQPLSLGVIHRVDAGQRVGHGIKHRFVHGGGQKAGKFGPVIQLLDHAADLVGAECMAFGFGEFQGRVIGGEARHLFAEIDVVLAGMDEAVGFKARRQGGDGAGDGGGFEKSGQVEHAVGLQFGAAGGDKGAPVGAVRPVERVAVKVDQVVHGSLRFWGRMARQVGPCNDDNYRGA